MNLLDFDLVFGSLPGSFWGHFWSFFGHLGPIWTLLLVYFGLGLGVPKYLRARFFFCYVYFHSTNKSTNRFATFKLALNGVLILFSSCFSFVGLHRLRNEKLTPIIAELTLDFHFFFASGLKATTGQQKCTKEL